ncbi:MAG: carbohydrate-binding family 9-like protein [Sorangiineae bacterium]|nr:carbohydrate-binding family 9-like protein [Sorangiineae bacterium]
MIMSRSLARSSSLFVLLAALGAGGCVGGSSEVTATDKEALKAYVLDKAPEKLPHRLDIDFDGKVTLLGYRIEPEGAVQPNQRVKLTMYWRSDKKLDGAWNLFTHLLDGSGERVMNIDNVGPIRELRGTTQVLGPSQWQAGKVYVDEQVFNVPAKLRTDKLQVVVGVWKDNDRLKPTSGPHDRENRGLVATLTTTTATAREKPAANTRVPTLRVDKLAKGERIKLDGKLDDEAWKTAPVAGPFVNVSTGHADQKSPVGGSVKVLWDDAGLYLGFDVKDADLQGGFKKTDKDPHLWKKSAVEIMIDPDGDGDNKDYYEIQVGPQNLVFDSHFDDYGQPKKEPDGPFGHQEWSAKLKSAVTVRGTIDESDDKDEGYTVELMIPWKSFSKAKSSPPKLGDVWRVNFYAMKNDQGVAWSPILGQGTFHKASRFGKILWAEKGWAPPIPAPLAAAPSAAPPASGSASPPAPSRPPDFKPLMVPERIREQLPLVRPELKPTKK